MKQHKDKLFASPAGSVAPVRLQRSAGEGSITFKCCNADTVLDDVRQSGCCKIRFPAIEPGLPFEAVLLNTAGGLTDDDVLRANVHWGPDTCALITTQAAERVYKSRDVPARVENRLGVARAAMAFWLPQETILFDGGRLSRRLEADIDEAGCLLACESTVFGRHAMGEAVNHGFLLDSWRVRMGGRLVFADSLRLDGAVDKILTRPATASGAGAAASVICVRRDVAGMLEPLRDVVSAFRSTAGCSVLGPVLVTRILAPDGAQLRKDLSRVLLHLITVISTGDGRLERRACLPRVWNC